MRRIRGKRNGWGGRLIAFVILVIMVLQAFLHPLARFEADLCLPQDVSRDISDPCCSHNPGEALALAPAQADRECVHCLDMAFAGGAGQQQFTVPVTVAIKIPHAGQALALPPFPRAVGLGTGGWAEARGGGVLARSLRSVVLRV